MRKKYMNSKVQPGQHQNIYVQSDFKYQQKQDYLQFFGTTDVKIDDKNFVNNHQNSKIGPGAYEAYAASFKNSRKAQTATFQTSRKDMLFGGNSNPGPQEYSNASTMFSSKEWQTNIGAFGSTERKFATFHNN